MDLTHPQEHSDVRDRYRVLVVGGGVAGLVAAHDLQKRGFDVVVLEAQNYAGGRIRTIQSNGYHAESGASVVTDQETETMDLLKELSVGPLIDLGLHGTDLSFGRKTVHLTRLDGRVNSPRDLWSLVSLAAAMAGSGNGHLPGPSLLRGYRAALKAIEEEQSFLQYPYEPSARPNWDTSTFAEFLDRFHPGLRALVDLQLKVTAGEVSDRISLFWGLVAFNWNVDGKFYWFKNGTSSFPLALAERLGNRLRLGWRAEQVTADGVVRVQAGNKSRDGLLSANAVIFAVPPSAVLPIAEGLSRGKREALARVQFGSYIVIHFVCRTRLWSGKIKAGYLNCATTVFADVLDSTKGQDGEAGILSCFIAGPEARRLIDATDGAIFCEVMRDLEKVFPGFVQTTIDCSITRWREAIPYFHPGYGQLIGELKKPEGRFFFCGDYTQGAGIHDAVVSGLRASEEVTHFLSKNA
jgi:protoporphyrinogen oxidase